MFFTALDVTSITPHIHNWMLFSLLLSLFILSGVISPLFSSSILGTFQSGHLSVLYLLAFSYCSCLGNFTTNKATGGDGIPAKLFQILKDDVMKLLHSDTSKFGKLSSGHRTGKGHFHSNPKGRQCQRMFKLLHNCTHLTC